MPRGRSYNSYSRSRSPRRGRYSRSRSPQQGENSRYYEKTGRRYERSYSRSPSNSRRGRGHERDESQIYVARFSRRTTESDLRRVFDRYGTISRIDLKENRGCAFIYYTSRRDAEDAIDEMNYRSLPHQDEKLIVEKAGLPRKLRRGRSREKDSRGRRSRSRGRGGSKDRRNDTCYNCQKPGHFARDCREQARDRAGADGRCFICDERGHKKINCPNRKNKPRRSVSSRNSKNSRKDSKSRSSSEYSRKSESKGNNRSRSFSSQRERSKKGQERNKEVLANDTDEKTNVTKAV